MNSRQTLFIGALAAGLAVALGAFGSHALKVVLETNQRLDTWQTAVFYQFVHALALLFIGLWQHTHLPKSWPALFFVLGILFFSGSLFVFSLTLNPNFAMVAPIGGICFIIGWTWLSIQILRKKKA